MIEISIHKKLISSEGEMHLEVNSTIQQGDLLALYGKSGAGKTSFLRILAGLLTPEEGQITVDGIPWLDTSKGINLAPQKRKVGLLFQDYALFPNMTVYDNLLFALSNGRDKKGIDDLVEIMELGELRGRKPETLSGGQKQRVALARALVQKPKILMLDEPLSSLDFQIRAKLQDYILHVHRQFGLTTLLVSHDVGEIIKMGNQAWVLENGKITQQATPSEVFFNKEVSGKFQFTGEVVSLEKQEFLYIVNILIGQDIVKVVADETEAKTLSLGDKVLVASKAFNPIIKKLS